VGAGMQDLGALPGDTGSRALAINDSGQVVGYSSGSGVRAFLWSKTSGMQSLGTLAGGHLSEAYSINDRGQVVGVSAGYAGTLAFLWTSKTGMQALGTLAGDTASRALHINDTGLVVGSSSGPTGTHAVLWNNASIQDLGTLGGLFSEAASINNTGVVVGASTTSLGGRAFVWTSVTGMQDLNSLIPSSSGVVLTGALGINDHGQIVAIGVVNVDTAHMVDLDDPHHAGPTHQFLLTPSGGAVAVTLYHSISQASINRGR
jgi:probable HAF family extracellular repeat protein